MHLHVFSVVGFEGAVVGLMEPDHDRHDFTRRQSAWPDPFPTAVFKLLLVPDWEICFAKIIDMAE